MAAGVMPRVGLAGFRTGTIVGESEKLGRRSKQRIDAFQQNDTDIGRHLFEPFS